MKTSQQLRDLAESAHAAAEFFGERKDEEMADDMAEIEKILLNLATGKEI